jgi:protein TonB
VIPVASEWRNPKYDIKAQSRSVFEQALSLSLALVILLFLTSNTLQVDEYGSAGEAEIVQIEDIPITDQLKVPPAPSRPMLPIPTESEEIPDDVTIMDTTVDLPTPKFTGPPGISSPPNGAGNSRIYLAWEQAPGLGRIVKPAYPSEAQRKNIEGRVVLSIVVDETGNVIEAIVVQSTPSGVFDEAAIESVMSWRFRPAKLRNQPIRVRLNQTVTFTLGPVG